MAQNPDSVIRVENMTRRFGGVLALDSVNMTLTPGEVHALVGQNGSGKSTLVKILSGYHAPNSGSVWLWDRYVKFPIYPPQRHGVAVIHQATPLVDDISALESFGVGSRYGTGHLKPISWRAERKLFEAYTERFGVELQANARSADMRPADRAILLMLRALRQLDHTADQRNAHGRLLILDEPSVYLPAHERGLLARAIGSVARSGVAVLLVSHNVDEVLSMSARVTVLRDGQLVATLDGASTSKEELINLILGRRLTNAYPTRSKATGGGEVVLSLRGVSSATVRDVTLDVHAGEVVGVTGLAGMGQDELPYLVLGTQRPIKGTIVLSPPDHDRGSTAVSIVPANRARDGLWMDGSLLENGTIGHVHSYASYGWIRKRRERRAVEQNLANFDVRPNRPAALARMLSGGNQQKVVLARTLGSNPKLLILHEPTQGVDVGARYEILRLVCEAVERGLAILVCSSDYRELEAICDRVLIFSGGRVTDSLEGERLSEANIALKSQGLRAV